MAKFSITILFSLFTIISGSLSAQWVQTQGPEGGFIRSIACNSSTVFAGTLSGLYRSTNNGVSWIKSVNGAYETTIYDICIAGSDVFASFGGVIYRSSDNGVNWNFVWNQITNSSISLFSTGNTIYAGSNHGIYKSTNRGTTWDSIIVNTGGNFIEKLHLLGEHILRITNGSLYVSHNNGATWESPGPIQGSYKTSLASIGNSLFVSTTQGVSTSINFGSNWTSVNTGLPASGNGWTNAVVASGTTLFAGVETQGVYYSTNNGLLWGPINTGLTDKKIISLAASGTNVFAGSWAGIQTSTNNGFNWQQGNSGIIAQRVNAFTSLGNNLFAGSEYGGVFRSLNEGASWVQVNSGLQNINVKHMASTSSAIFAGGNGIYRSTNSGTNWVEVSNPFVRNYGLITTPDNKIFAIRDFSPACLVSTNNGDNWTSVSVANPEPFGYSLIFSSGNNIYLDGNYKLHASTDNGITWNGYATPDSFYVSMGAASGSNVLAMMEKFSEPDRMYKSSNNGVTWAQVTMPSTNVYSLTGKDNIFFAATSEGVFLSKDYGATWINRNQGYVSGNNSFPYALYFFNNNVYMGTHAKSVYKRNYSDIIGIKNISSVTPDKFLLSQNYPNPFNPATKINFSLPLKSFVRLKVYNSLGKEVANLVNENLQSGIYEYSFNGQSLTSGIYFYKLETDNFSETKKMMLIK